MKIRLDQILDEPFSFSETRSLEVNSFERSQLLDLSDIAWTGTVSRATSGFFFTAELRYEQTLACPRCLGPVEAPVAVTVELAILPRRQEPTVGEYELEDSDLSVHYIDVVDGEILDTDPLLKEQLHLNIPMRQLCRENCAGLCPVCGANRNVEDCRCESEDADPRWAALAELKTNK